MMERFELAAERLGECLKEQFPIEAFDRYFKEAGSFLNKMCVQYLNISSGAFNVTKMSQEELAVQNCSFYENVLPEKYETSFLNPAYAVKELGEEYGRL